MLVEEAPGEADVADVVDVVGVGVDCSGWAPNGGVPKSCCPGMGEEGEEEGDIVLVLVLVLEGEVADAACPRL